MPRCSGVEPPLREISPGHRVACHLYEAGKGSPIGGGSAMAGDARVS